MVVPEGGVGGRGGGVGGRKKNKGSLQGMVDGDLISISNAKDAIDICCGVDKIRVVVGLLQRKKGVG